MKSTFLVFSITLILIVILFVIAMIFYPGGNWVNDDVSSGYSFIYNGMCDMREPYAINGEPNPISSMILKIATIGLSFVLILFFGAIWVIFQNKSSTKYLSWIASLFGIIFGPFNIAIIFTHTAFELHMVFNIVAPLSLNLAILLYTIIFFINKQLPPLNQYTFLGLSVCAVTYSAIVGIAAGIDGIFNMITHRLGSNLLYAITMIIFFIQGITICLNLRRIKDTKP